MTFITIGDISINKDMIKYVRIHDTTDEICIGVVGQIEEIVTTNSTSNYISDLTDSLNNIRITQGYHDTDDDYSD